MTITDAQRDRILKIVHKHLNAAIENAEDEIHDADFLDMPDAENEEEYDKAVDEVMAAIDLAVAEYAK